MQLTDRQLKSLNPKEIRYDVWESNIRGLGTLGVRISPKGTRTWIFQYRYDGKARILILGKYPRMSVAQAHAKHGQILETLEQGLDPAIQIVDERRALKQSLRVCDLADEYIEKYAKPRKKSWSDDERLLRKEVLPLIGSKRSGNIKRTEIISILDGICNRGTPVVANRTLAVIRKMFNFALNRELIQSSPCVAIEAPHKEQSVERSLDDSELRMVLTNLHKSKLNALCRDALRILLLTAQRPGEVLNMEWSELDESLSWWRIPELKTKNGHSNQVPLSSQAQEIIRSIKDQKLSNVFVFPSDRKDATMTRTVLSRGVKRSLTKQPDGTGPIFDMSPWTPHDLRRTAASQMTSLGIPQLIVDKILNHAERGIIRVYDRYTYRNEKKDALAIWGNKVQQLSLNRSEDRQALSSEEKHISITAAAKKLSIPRQSRGDYYVSRSKRLAGDRSLAVPAG